MNADAVVAIGTDEWKPVRFGDFTTLQRGFDLPDHKRESGNVPILGSFGITGRHSIAKVKGPGVTVGRSGASFGVVAYSGGDFWPLNTALYVKDFHGNNERFAYYFLRNFDFSAFNSGSAQPSLNRNAVHPIWIRVPSRPEQDEIADILDSIDTRIDSLRVTNDTLEAMARAIFKSWFVDFDPVRAKAEGREPEGMDAATAALFPSEFQDSELGPIPRGWSVATLEEFSSLNPESWSKSTRPSRVRYVDLANTKWGRIDAVAEFEQADAPSRAQRILRQGDSIIGTVRPGNGSYALIGDEGLTGSTGFAVLRPKERHLAPYVYLAATESSNIDRLSSLADGGAYPAVRPEAVIRTPIVSPPSAVLSSFGDITVPLLARIDAAEKQVRTLSDLRDTLLPRLISGKLRVPEVEALLAETL